MNSIDLAIYLYFYIVVTDICIWQLKNAVNGVSFEYKKAQNSQVVHKNLRILGFLILFLMVLKHSLKSF